MRAVVLFFLAGCAGVTGRGQNELAKHLEERMGARKIREDQVAELLARGLTRSAAIEIALINNPALQATYEDMGISEADMVQAGLLKNPRFSLALGFGGSFELEAALVQDFLDLFMLPMRKKIAEEQFAAEVLHVSHEAIAVCAQVAQEFAEVQAATELLSLRQAIAASAATAAELAAAQLEAGNINALLHAEQQAFSAQAQLEVQREQAELIAHREKLNVLLGLSRDDWTLSETLALLPESDPALDALETRAVNRRLDLAAARKRVEILERAVKMAKTFRFVGALEIGVDAHRDPDGPMVYGPNLSLELPIFDQRQALIAKLEAQHRQIERRFAAATVQARADVRANRAKMVAARTIAERYRDVLVPLRTQNVLLSQRYFNGMFIGLYELLQTKQHEIEASRAYVEARRDYWSARAQLELTLGERL